MNTVDTLRKTFIARGIKRNTQHELYRRMDEIGDYIDSVFTGTAQERVDEYIVATLANYPGFLIPSKSYNGFASFEDFFSGYIGEFRWRDLSTAPGHIKVTYVGVGVKIRGDRLELQEIYAESIWGRSHEKLGTVHLVEISDLTPVGLEAKEIII